jgi:hypothetical protein
VISVEAHIMQILAFLYLAYYSGPWVKASIYSD